MGSLDYTPELTKAKKELFRYMEEHKLSFEKDYRNDPIHGKKISLLLLKINKERDKIIEEYPLHDQDNNRKFLTLKTKRSIMSKVKKTKVAKAKEADALVEKKATNKTEKVKKEKKVSRGRGVTKYNYPLIDGREMTAAEKKKYRMEQRKAAAGDAPKVKKGSKKNTKEKSEKKESKVKDKKKNRKVKDED